MCGTSAAGGRSRSAPAAGTRVTLGSCPGVPITGGRPGVGVLNEEALTKVSLT